MPEYLLGKERIALSLVVHRADEALVAEPSGDAGDQLAQLVGAEAVEHDSLEGVLAAHLGERLR